MVINNEILCNIEMFSHFNEDAFQKSKSYILRIYSTQLNIGDDYSKIKKVTQINFVDNVNKDIKVMIDEEIKRTLYLGNELTSKDLNLDIVRLDLARKIEYNENDKFMKLLKFLSANTLEEREKFAKGTPIEEISEITELSLEEIKNLQNEN